MTAENPEVGASRWPNDVLGRDRLADFLSRSLSSQSAYLATVRDEGLTVALDAGWGTGKSFFVKHWARDLEAAGHPIAIFDAWKNDIGDEAAVALMATIRKTLNLWITKLPVGHRAHKLVKEAATKTIKKLRRAIVPTLKVVATGLFKKATGMAVDELLQAVQSQDEVDGPTPISNAMPSVVDDGLDKLFEESLSEHQNRIQAIVEFRSSISELVRLLQVEAGAVLPMFVFIDELDRCRPSYAIKLLEEVKHLFGVKDVCFVVSTNLSQLQESVRAVYGGGFDGYGYLKRFFDQSYTLPDPNSIGFASMLLHENAILKTRTLVHGLPQKPGSHNSEAAIALVFSSFALDLRSQQQAFAIANSAVAAVAPGRNIYLLWLFFLCSMRHKFPALYARLISNRLDHAQFLKLCSDAFQKDELIEYQIEGNNYGQRPETRVTTLSSVMWSYYDMSLKDLKDIRKSSFNVNVYDYPANNIIPIAEEMPNTFNPNKKYVPSIAAYVEIVKYAGLTGYEQSGSG